MFEQMFEQKFPTDIPFCAMVELTTMLPTDDCLPMTKNRHPLLVLTTRKSRLITHLAAITAMEAKNRNAAKTPRFFP
ncbi:MAG: hypothetical protein H6672_11325 [Anaerolineaceae bacterium]|nr:hypothetical protein [Anaerolineaceae bacterium]